MSKSPYLHAILATTYIVMLVSAITFASRFTKDTPDTILAPIAMLSLFVLSAAVMGYLFVMQPLAMYLDGKRTDAVSFFMKTVATFAVITCLLMFAAFIFSVLVN